METNIIAHNTDSENRTKDVTIQDNLTFQSMFLSEKLLKGLTSCGFRKPSPIQLNAIPVGRCGFDLIVKSKAGTGKTVVFSVISLEVINTDINDLQVLILAPTREIAVQIADVISSIGKNFEDLKVSSFIGGLPEKDDIEKAQNCHIAVGAPGRIKSLIKQKILKVHSLKLFVLDEADKLMEKNFQNDLNEIYYNLPYKKQIIATSATFPEQLNEFLSNYMQSPTQINVEFESPLLLGLKQYIKEVKPSYNSIQEMNYKNEKLIQLLESISFTQCLIFSNYQTRVETVSIMLSRAGWNSTFISAAQTQIKRLEVMENLKNFKCRVLLSTDLTARGIDVANIDLVINYDVPVDVMTYLHRMGRAGRYGSRGLCITLVSGDKDMKKIQKYLGILGGTSLTISKLPDIKEKQVDLWETDTKEFEQISGIVETEDDNRNLSLSVKHEIMKLKTNIVKHPQMHSETNNIVEENEIDDIFEDQKALKDLNSLHLNEEKSITSEMDNENCEIELDDSRIALESMAKGMFNFESIEAASSKPPLENVSIHESLSTRDKGRNRISLDNQNNTLMSLAEGKFDFAKLSCVNFNNVFCGEKSCEHLNNTKSTKTYNLKSIKNEDDNRNIIFLKNKAVYEVAKILTYKLESIDSDMEENLNNYFKFLTDQNSLMKELSENDKISHIEVLKSVFQPSTSDEVDKKCTEPSSSRDASLDNIFLHAYKFAIRGEKHWKLVVPEIELNENNQDEHMESEVSDEYCEVISMEFSEEDDNISGIEYNENGKRIYAYEDIPNRMVWVPVEKGVLDSNDGHPRINLLECDSMPCVENMPAETSVDRESTNEYSDSKLRSAQLQQNQCTNSVNIFKNVNSAEQLESYSHRNMYRDRFVACFDECSGELWHDGWKFNSVEDFDYWFHNWQEKVQNVRDYIRQNIYVKELSDFQNNKEKH